MADFFRQLNPASPLRQGDVFKFLDPRKGWAILLTADCDLANRKFAGILSCLSVCTATTYLDGWCAEKCEKLSQRHAASSAKAIQAADTARPGRPTLLSPEDLLDWLNTHSPDQIVASLESVTGKAATILASSLGHITTLNASGRTGLQRLRDYWRDDGKKAAVMSSELRDALAAAGSAHFFFPYLPGEKDVGFVANLRSIVLVPETSAFANKTDLLLADLDDPQPLSMIRIGHLADFLRFALAQQTAALYSRIGMTSEFEDECSTAIDVLIEQALGD